MLAETPGGGHTEPPSPMNAQSLAAGGHSTAARATEPDITGLLAAWRGGDSASFDRLFPLVYDELRRIAHRLLAGEREGHTLQTTALVHEAYLRLIDQTRAQWADRSHFFAVAAGAMRRILVDYARRQRAGKRGGGLAPVPLDDTVALADRRADELLALDEALDRLGAIQPRQARVVECRFFGGLTDEETAQVLSVTSRSVRRDWAAAKTWLASELQR